MSTLALAFVAGVSGSIGPCAAPRYLAMAGIAGGTSTHARLRVLLAFSLGVTCASVLLVESASLVAATIAWSDWLYGVLSFVFLIVGAWSLLALPETDCPHEALRAPSFGGAFSLGATCALVPSVCCTPFLLGIGALGASATPGANAAAGAAFAIGHLSALGVAVVGSWPLLRMATSGRAREAARTIGAGLSLALAAYYAVLA